MAQQQTMSNGGIVARFVRAGALTVLVVLLTLAAHTMAGGHAPSWTAVLGLGAVVLLIASAFAGRRLGLAPVVALLAAGQVGLHLGFSWWAARSVVAVMHGGVMMDMAPEPTSLSASMLLTHAVAGLVLALVWARGEAILAALRHWMLPWVSTPVLAPPGRRPIVAVHAPTHVERLVFLLALPRRGPPVAFV